jgi:NAD(P)-dependent dehydrogenase (short-subunit alcohol dehydrogenase family)
VYAARVRSPNPDFDLTGKVALVTASSRGIGKAIALAMGRAGAKVVVSSRKLDACQLVVDEIVRAGGEAIAIACHAGKREELVRLVDETRARWGRIDTLVCNAAVNPAFGPLSTLADDAFDKIFATNVKSTLWLCNLVVPEMRDRGDGSVIIVSSITALRGNPVIGAYGMSKAAEAQLVRNLAVEQGGANVRVNGIAPGLIKTDFAKMLWQNEELHGRVVARTPLNRLGEPDDIGAVAVFLASPAARYLTGQLLVVDGGASIADPLV